MNFPRSNYFLREQPLALWGSSLYQKLLAQEHQWEACKDIAFELKTYNMDSFFSGLVVTVWPFNSYGVIRGNRNVNNPRNLLIQAPLKIRWENFYWMIQLDPNSRLHVGVQSHLERLKKYNQLPPDLNYTKHGLAYDVAKYIPLKE